MSTPKIFESEYRFMLILWESEPLPAARLAALCKDRLGWSRTTTYTVIKRLTERGAVRNEGGAVTPLVSKNEIQTAEIDELVEKTFEGSLPAFIAAFVGHRRLTESEREELLRLIDGETSESCPDRSERGEGGEEA